MNDIQKKILEIFKIVAQLCDENNIHYFAIGGSCIGAVRHNGFIPWDDDIDIAIPIEEFDNFLKIMEKKLPNNLKIRSASRVKHFSNMFVKIIDINTTFIEQEEYEFIDAYKGVFVDIMPISGIPENKLKQRYFSLKLRILSFFNYLIRYPRKNMQNNLKKILWDLAFFIRKNVSYKYFSDKYYEVLKNYPFYTSKYIGYVWVKLEENLIFEQEYFKERIKIPFEDIEMFCPKGWHEYLTKQFGDYMKLPPIEDQKSLHSGIIDLEKSFIEYQKEKKLKGDRK